MESLGRGLRKHGYSLTNKQHRSYVAQAQELIADGVRRKEMGAVLGRVVERWESYRNMPLATAREDLQRKKANARPHDPVRDGWTEEQRELLYPTRPAWVRHDPIRHGLTPEQERAKYGEEEPENEPSTGGEEEVPVTAEDLDAMSDAAPFYGARRR